MVRINTAKNSLEYSQNSGRSWVSRCINSSYGIFVDLLPYGSELLACTSKGLYVSSNQGRSFSPRCTNTSSYGDFLNLQDAGTELLANTSKGLYYSRNAGRSWVRRYGEQKENHLIDRTMSNENKGNLLMPIVWMTVAILYDVSPVDVIPDIPVVGWVDDFFITATATLNLVQKAAADSVEWLSAIAKSLKWITITLGIIAILLVLISGAVIVKMFS